MAHQIHRISCLSCVILCPRPVGPLISHVVSAVSTRIRTQWMQDSLHPCVAVAGLMADGRGALGRRPSCVDDVTAWSKAVLISEQVRGMPGLACLDDSCMCDKGESSGESAECQLGEAAEALQLSVAVASLCGYNLSVQKCNLRPARVRRYPGILCDSHQAAFRGPQHQLDKLRKLAKRL